MVVESWHLPKGLEGTELLRSPITPHGSAVPCHPRVADREVPYVELRPSEVLEYDLNAPVVRQLFLLPGSNRVPVWLRRRLD